MGKNIVWLYKEFSKKDDSVSYKEFKEILKLHNQEMLNSVISGKRYIFGFKLGALLHIVKDKKFKTTKDGTVYTSINWGETNKKRKELIEQGQNPEFDTYVVYNTNNKTIRYYWNKYKVRKRSGGYHLPLERIRNYTFHFSNENKRRLARENLQLLEL